MHAISLDQTVASIAAEVPGAADLFRRSGINFCCGGQVTALEAADRAGIAPDILLADLAALDRDAAREAPVETSALIDHLLFRYHQTHRKELEFLIPLAMKVERVHGDHPLAPIGLAHELIAVRDELEIHMSKEEQALFPMMQRGGSAVISHPIAQMRHDHDGATEHLSKIEQVTHGLTLPTGACGSWTALYTGVRKFNADLVSHMHLENAILFPRFETPAPPASA